MDEILERVVQDEVSIIFRKEIEDLNKDYMEFAKFDLSKNTDWKNFKEFFYRRNIILHNNGIVNSTYREKTGSTSGNVHLSVDENYLSKAITMFENCSKIVAKHFKNKFA
jgi:hypothetical protein